MEALKKPLGREGLLDPASLILKFNFSFVFNCVCTFLYVGVHMSGGMCTCVHTHVEARDP